MIDNTYTDMKSQTLRKVKFSKNVLFWIDRTKFNDVRREFNSSGIALIWIIHLKRHDKYKDVFFRQDTAALKSNC